MTDLFWGLAGFALIIFAFGFWVYAEDKNER